MIISYRSMMEKTGKSLDMAQSEDFDQIFAQELSMEELDQALLELESFVKLDKPAEVILEGASFLKKPAYNSFSEDERENLCIKAVERQLGAQERQLLKNWLKEDKSLQTTFRLYKNTRLQKDFSVVFEGKQKLKKTSWQENMYPWLTRFLAAACFILFVLAFWNPNEPMQTQTIVLAQDLPTAEPLRIAQGNVVEQTPKQMGRKNIAPIKKAQTLTSSVDVFASTPAQALQIVKEEEPLTETLLAQSTREEKGSFEDLDKLDKNLEKTEKITLDFSNEKEGAKSFFKLLSLSISGKKKQSLARHEH
jgi:hypothetical protein